MRLFNLNFVIIIFFVSLWTRKFYKVSIRFFILVAKWIFKFLAAMYSGPLNPCKGSSGVDKSMQDLFISALDFRVILDFFATEIACWL